MQIEWIPGWQQEQQGYMDGDKLCAQCWVASYDACCMVVLGWSSMFVHLAKQDTSQMTIIQPSASDVEQGGPPGIPMRLLIQLVRAQTASLAHHSAAKVARVSI